MELIKRLAKEEEGQALTEYGLLLGLIAIGVVAVLVVMGPKLVAIFEEISDALP